MGKQTIVNKPFVLKKYDDNKAPVGTFKYPFVFKLPDWLPSSLIFACENFKSVAAVKY